MSVWYFIMLQGGQVDNLKALACIAVDFALFTAARAIFS